ncbi:hypothetical protein [Hippea alviniae]|uniref:hypothetical protein n=1 Tax=Hippea alviniae TaxID=1279027 RepID=UPI0003B56F2A|nr:hypothetical protein [Hippea alviniae]
MVRIELTDIDLSDDFCDIYFEDDEGYTYKFRTDAEKGKMISLLAHGVYVQNNSVYELLLNLLNMTGLGIHSVVVLDGYKDRAVVNLTDSKEIKSLPVNIDDALILGLLSEAPLFVKKEACFLEIEELERYIWYRFLKELDLC